MKRKISEGLAMLTAAVAGAAIALLATSIPSTSEPSNDALKTCTTYNIAVRFDTVEQSKILCKALQQSEPTAFKERWSAN